MLLKIFKNRTVSSSGTWGTKNENNYEILNFEFPEELEEYNKRIVYYLGNQKVWDAIIDNKAILTNAITTKGSVKAYIWCTKSDEAFETDVDFRTQIFVMNFFENENADGIVPTPEQVDGFNTMLTAMNEKIEEINELETTIENAETQRQENEETRQENESTRQENEQTRQEQEAERERRTDEAIGNIEDKTAEYNANAEAKTTAFNNNATQKTNDFNNNYTQKVNDFNTNASSKELAFNSNASSKTSAFNSNASSKTTDFNTNAENKTTAFNSNATDKTTNFDNNASSKTTTFNENATSKTNDFNDNATQKTTAFNNNAQAKTEAFDEHTAEITADIEDLQQEVEELSENMPWNETEQATEISVDDAAKYSKNKLELFGNTSQDSTSGSQAIDYSEVINREVNFNDVTLLISTTNFNIKADTTYYIRWIFTDNTYVDASSTLDNIRFYNGTSIQKQFGGTNMVFTSQELDGITSVQVRATGTFASTYAGKTIKALVFSSDVNKITSDTYEPYTNGPSPNPDYPQPIHVVTGNNSIGVQGKNLFNKDVERRNAYPSGNIGEQINYVPSDATCSYIKCVYLKAGTTYKISWKQNENPTSANDRRGRIVDESNNVLEAFTSWHISNNEISYTPNSTGYLVLATDKNASDIQIEQGSTVTSYVPYYHADYPINLGSLELCKIGNYQDYLYKDGDNWYKHNKVSKYILKGTENYTKSSTYSNEKYFCGYIPNPVAYIDEENGFINKFQIGYYTQVLDKECMRINGQFHVRILANRLSENSADGFKNYLANLYEQNTPVIAYYIPRTPTSTQITDETLISQLEAIYNHLALVKGTNHITITPSDLEPYVTLNYMQDLPSKLDNLDSRLSLLE